MSQGRTARSLAGLAMAVLLVGGCAETHAAATPPPATSPAATSTAALPALGPADLPMPAKARLQTPGGFNEFTKYYISLINRLSKDLDPTYLRQFSRDCPTCNRIANDAAGDLALGRSYQGGTLTITALAPAHMISESQAETAFVTIQDAYVVLDSSGAPVPGLSSAALPEAPAGTLGEWTGDHWILTNLSFG